MMTNQPNPPLRLGTRGSPLALAQAGLVADALCAAHGWDREMIAVVPVKTTGDLVQDRPLAAIGGKALWTKELDRALAETKVDFTVHSMKDVETQRPETIRIAALLPRGDVRDRLIGAESLESLPEGVTLGTSSPRRAAQILNLRPDIRISTLRGNVATRMQAVAAGDISATLLAAAGLDRLGQSRTGVPLPTDVMLPAAQQGAIGIETLAYNTEMAEILAPIDDRACRACVACERTLLEALGADCHSPVAALAEIADSRIRLRAQLLTLDGSETVSACSEGDGDSGTAIAAAVAEMLFAQASPELRQLFAG